MDKERPPAPTVELAVVTRSGRVESRHRGALAVVRGDRTLCALGDVDAPVWVRSAVKPFQALPFLERGLDRGHGFDDRHRALLGASHDGTPEHVAAVEDMLTHGGFGTGDLRCGPHAPLDPASRRALARRGGEPTRTMNNCSGKHTGFLYLARALGQDPEEYLDPEGAAQRAVREVLADFTGISGPPPTGVDGCGAPTFHLPLRALARAFARWANPDDLPAVRAAACRRSWTAITRAPVFLAGERRLCTALVRAVPGRIHPKNGAEGVYAFALRDTGIGVAVKVADGADRGCGPVVVEVLRRLLGWRAVPGSLAAHLRPTVSNTQGRAVGSVECTAPLPVALDGAALFDGGPS